MNELQLYHFDLSMLKECIDLYIDVFSKEPWFEENNLEEVERYFLNFYESNKFIGYVIKKEEKIIGVSIGFLKPWIKGEEYYIDQYYIDFNYQGVGIGSFFMKEIRKNLAERGVHAIILATEKQFPSFRFYIKNGFTNLEDLCFLGTEF